MQGKVNKNELAKKAGMDVVDAGQPILMQLLNAFNSGAKGNASDLGSGMKPSAGFSKEESKKVEPLSFGGDNMPNV